MPNRVHSLKNERRLAAQSGRSFPRVRGQRRPGPPGTREQPTRTGSGRRGALRSEIKEERRAQPDSGDIRGAECPVGLIPRRLSRATANNCIGLIGNVQIDAVERHCALAQRLDAHLCFHRGDALRIETAVGDRKSVV